MWHTQRDRPADRQVADHRHRIGDRTPQQAEEANRGGAVRAEVDVGAQLADGALSPAFGQLVDECVCDLVERSAPRYALPAAAAPRPDALQVARARTLVAAAGIEIRNRVVRRRVIANLLLAKDDPLAHVEIPGARRHTIGVGVRAPHDAFPGEATSVHVAPIAIARSGGGNRRNRDRSAKGEIRQPQYQGSRCACAQDFTTRVARGHRASA